ncbi:hypothetical protein [Streptomyces nigrescens]|uniref:hypothetical protein n=1 Tax=Streptomyces nigrescens TaxID=1920 RepID=UPI0036F5951E
MSPFSVYVEFDAPNTPPAVLSEIYESLVKYGGNVSTASNGNLVARLFVEAESALDAGTRGVEYAQAAALQQGITPETVVGFEVVTEAEFERRLGEPLVPELAGAAEAAAIVHVTNTRIGQLLDKGDLRPHHVQTLASGPVFLADGLRRYAEHIRTSGQRRRDLPLSEFERALLEVLAAAAHRSTPLPSTTEHHRQAAGAIEEMVGNAQVRLHVEPATSALASALDQLVGHRLVRTRGVYRKEERAGHEDDLVVTVLGKGMRHAGVDSTPAADEQQEQAH